MDPLDYQKYRHAGVLVNFLEEDHDDIFVHAIGTTKMYDFQHREHYEPEKSVKLVAMVPVGQSQKTVSSTQILNEARTIPVNNKDMDWNCQNWIHDFLKGLSDKGIITSQQVKESFDKMVTVTMEAEHEPQ